ncbi:MAG: 2-dehydropantoate 2-reductase N-terminal domain-containing protein [Adlercreutzia sp.]
MKFIENVAIVGFGSLGAMYAACFGGAMGSERVFVVADAARTERYRAEAATFNGEPIRVTYLTYEEAAERAAVQPFDVVLYAVKYGALSEAIEQSSPLVSLDTAVISVLNGITSEEVLAERFGWDRVLLCIAQQMDSRKVGAVVTAGCVGVMALGVRDPEDAAQRANLARVTEWLAAIEQPFITPVDIQHQLWGKLICNVGVNQACAVYDCCFNGIHAPARRARP